MLAARHDDDDDDDDDSITLLKRDTKELGITITRTLQISLVERKY